MSAGLEAVGYGMLVPAVVALVLCRICRKLLPPVAAQRYAAGAAAAIAFLASYALLPSWAALRPERHWHWLPHLGLAALVFGLVGPAAGLRTVERWLPHAALAIVAAWLLVPLWADLSPSRPICIALLALYLWALMTGIDALPAKLRGKSLMIYLTMAAALTALLLAAAISLRFGQLAGIAAAALAGCAVATRWQAEPIEVRGMLPVFAVLVGGCAFIGCIERQPPLSGLLLAPAAPLILWSFVYGPLATLPDKTAVAVQAATLLTIFSLAAVWVLALS